MDHTLRPGAGTADTVPCMCCSSPKPSYRYGSVHAAILLFSRAGVYAERSQACSAWEHWESTSASCCAAGRAPAAVHCRAAMQDEAAGSFFISCQDVQGRRRRVPARRNAREALAIDVFWVENKGVLQLQSLTCPQTLMSLFITDLGSMHAVSG